MSVALLDVNVLIGLLWQPHDFHRAAMEWFLAHRNRGWATCPLTQNGFVRILSNPNLYRNGPQVEEAIQLLSSTINASKDHHFWPADLSIVQWPQGLASAIHGHHQITDAYLLQLTIRNRGTFVTFDRRMLQLAPQGSPERKALTLLTR